MVFVQRIDYNLEGIGIENQRKVISTHPYYILKVESSLLVVTSKRYEEVKSYKKLIRVVTVFFNFYLFGLMVGLIPFRQQKEECLLVFSNNFAVAVRLIMVFANVIKTSQFEATFIKTSQFEDQQQVEYHTSSEVPQAAALVIFVINCCKNITFLEETFSSVSTLPLK